MLVHPGVYGFVEMVIFVPVLTVGLIYAWRNYRGKVEFDTLDR